MTVNNIIKDYLIDYLENNVGIANILEVIRAFEECENYKSYTLINDTFSSYRHNLIIYHYDSTGAIVMYNINLIYNLDDHKYYITELNYNPYY